MHRKALSVMFVIAVVSLLMSESLATQPLSPSGPESQKFETRCGWLNNPTPGNHWLNDRDGEWIIGVQGGYQIETDWPWPAFKKEQWIDRYGYGCACLQVRVDKQTSHVLEIKSARPRPLAACRKEPSLKKLERNLR